MEAMIDETNRQKPPLRCYHHRCNRFAPTPEGWGANQIVSFPECPTCRMKRERREKRAAVLMANVARVL